MEFRTLCCKTPLAVISSEEGIMIWAERILATLSRKLVEIDEGTTCRISVYLCIQLGF